MKKLKKVDLHNTENELIESIKRGNTDAFRRFFKLYEKSIAKIVIELIESYNIELQPYLNEEQFQNLENFAKTIMRKKNIIQKRKKSRF